MKCEICRKDIGETIVYLPIKQPDGCLNTQACLECAEKSPTYCLIHNCPHESWGDDMKMTRCYHCAKELTEKNLGRAKILVGLVEDAAREDVRSLYEDRCIPFLNEEEKEGVMLFVFASSALAMKIELDELIHRIVSAGSLEVLRKP